jgi:biotin carboxyl carrier protein
MPGLINAVDVKVGQEVELGQPVVVLEAMKLMIQLVAPVAGKVKELFCAPGQTVPVGTVLVEIEPAQI